LAVIKEGLECLAHYLLDEYKAPELEFEPIRSIAVPSFVHDLASLGARTDRGASDEIRHINVRLSPSQPLGWSMNRYLVVVNANRADGAFAEVEIS